MGVDNALPQTCLPPDLGHRERESGTGHNSLLHPRLCY